MQYIWYVAGKSGGHIIPALTHLQQWIEKNPNDRIIFFSNNTPLDYKLLQNQKIIFKHCTLPLSPFPGKKAWLYPLFVWNAFNSFCKIVFYRLRYKPLHIISMGGLVSVPVCLIGKLFNIPFDQYELNAIPGKAINFLSKWARTTFVCFTQAQNYLPAARCTLTAYPLRYFRATFFKVPAGKKVILVLGGSQGSQFINNFIQHYCKNFEKSSIKKLFGPAFSPENVHIIHQTGTAQEIKLQEFYKNQGISATIFAFKDDLSPYYQTADLIISRAGAGTLFEIAHFKKKALIIPLEITSTNHQRDNAEAITQEYPDLFIVIRQKDINL